MSFAILMALASCVATAVDRARLQMDDRLAATTIVDMVRMICTFEFENPTHPFGEQRRDALRTLAAHSTLEVWGASMFARAVDATAVRCAAMCAAAWLAWAAAHMLAKELGEPPPHCKRTGPVRALEMASIYCCSVAGYTGHEPAEVDEFVYFATTGRTRTPDGKEWV